MTELNFPWLSPQGIRDELERTAFVRAGMRAGLAVIFGLGVLQGGVGWWMVASGLSDRIHVSHDRLAFHFTLACVIYAAIIWTAARLVPTPLAAGALSGEVHTGSPQTMRPAETPPLRLRLGAFVLVALTIMQFFLGALVAGLRAGLP